MVGNIRSPTTITNNYHLPPVQLCCWNTVHTFWVGSSSSSGNGSGNATLLLLFCWRQNVNSNSMMGLLDYLPTWKRYYIPTKRYYYFPRRFNCCVVGIECTPTGWVVRVEVEMVPCCWCCFVDDKMLLIAAATAWWWWVDCIALPYLHLPNTTWKR